MRLIVQTIMGATAVAFGVADTTQNFPLGTRALSSVDGVSSTSNVLNAGGGEYIYAKGAAAMDVGTPVTLNSNTGVATALANTANLGCAVFFAANRHTAADEYGWFCASGLTPVVNNGTFAADVAIFIQAAGVLSSTVAAGKQILSARSVIAAAATFTKTGKTVTGSKVVKFDNLDGVFAGLAVSGTGIAASSEVNDIDLGARSVTLNNAATASGSVTITFTYTALGAAYVNHPFAQGQIT